MLNPHIVRKSTSPTSTPPEAGIHWINTSTREEFFSVGTSSVLDWIPRAAKINPEVFLLTQEHIEAKAITLSRVAPFPEFVSLAPRGGLVQDFGVDFTVEGNILSWDGLGLDGQLEAGDEIIVHFT